MQKSDTILGMEDTILCILERLREGLPVDNEWLDRLMREQNRKAHDPSRQIAKKRLLPYYLHERDACTERFRSWGIDDATDERIVGLLRAKPRRTASGVATVTVLTKPWPCGGGCLYCPNDIRMPKSYLADEPACQRAERCFFDPYLQVASRIRVLTDMGHNTDKVELIILGGTWSEYDLGYRIWFVTELFRALNDMGTDSLEAHMSRRRNFYSDAGMTSDPDELKALSAADQKKVNAGEATYNEVVARMMASAAQRDVARMQTGTYEELFREQGRNEDAGHRNVGLVVESRPELLTRDELTHLRRLGCTKVQMGVQSLRPELLSSNTRTSSLAHVERAFLLLREYGFKSHVHFMVNLLGAAPESDKRDYAMLVEDERFRPDEAKLYPCALVESSALVGKYEEGAWQPYTEDELLDVLAADVIATPPWMRISRMIRDISAKDILVGNKKTNLRQLVEEKVRASETARVCEMRMREIATEESAGALNLDDIEYETTNTHEHFLQYLDENGRLAAFLRLSLPKSGAAAMIREVHVYGKVSRLHESKEGVQHTGLGRRLIAEAERLSAEQGRKSIKVISAIGTRNYYRALGYRDIPLYQEKLL